MQSISRIRRVLGYSLLLFMGILVLIGLGFKPLVAVSAPAATIDFVSSMGGSVTSIAISGTIAYVGQGGTFAAFDIRDPGHISRLDNIPLPDFALQIQLVGSLAYIADGFGGLQIIDVSDPVDLSVSGSYSMTGTSRDVDVIENFAYILNTSSMQIIDVTNPVTPTLRGSYPFTHGGCYGIEVVEGLAYVAGSSGLTIIDISDPAHPQFVGSYLTGVQAVDVQVTGSLAILVEGGLGGSGSLLQVIDISTPASPILLGQHTSTPGHK